MAKQDTKKEGAKSTKAEKPVEKKAPKKEKPTTVKLDKTKFYKVESNGTGPRMSIKGEILKNVGGTAAEFLVNNGFGKIVE